MFVLMLEDGERAQYIGVFDTLESGRRFMSRVPGYSRKEIRDGEWTFEEEKVDLHRLPDVVTVDYNGYRIPISRFSFEADPMVIWIELDHLDGPVAAKAPVISRGATRIDAYSIDNEEVEEYVRRREAKYRECIAFLESRGYEVSRECFGSEDGEVLFIRKSGDAGWRFFTHMDPSFLELDPKKEMGEWE